MSKPNVVEICICTVPTPLFDDESGQYFDSDCGGLLKDRSYGSERVIVNMTMVKIGDKLLELDEHLDYEKQLVADLTKLMQDWAAVLTPGDK